jgi:hypothetical protein
VSSRWLVSAPAKLAHVAKNPVARVRVRARKENGFMALWVVRKMWIIPAQSQFLFR